MGSVQDLLRPERVGFLVVSDEPQRALGFDGLAVRLLAGSALEDMYSLAYCDYIIGPHSTFSMWASFYGETPLYRLEDPYRTVSPEDFVVDATLVERPPADYSLRGFRR
jgi:hypothetical protein